MNNRHWCFALETIKIGSAKNSLCSGLVAKVRAYQRIYPRASYASARACASRLIRHPDVSACRNWFLAKAGWEIPMDEPMPKTGTDIWLHLHELECWRSHRAPWYLKPRLETEM